MTKVQVFEEAALPFAHCLMSHGFDIVSQQIRGNKTTTKSVWVYHLGITQKNLMEIHNRKSRHKY